MEWHFHSIKFLTKVILCVWCDFEFDNAVSLPFISEFIEVIFLICSQFIVCFSIHLKIDEITCFRCLQIKFSTIVSFFDVINE